MTGSCLTRDMEVPEDSIRREGVQPIAVGQAVLRKCLAKHNGIGKPVVKDSKDNI